MTRSDEVCALVVKLGGERAWVAACMSKGSADVISQEDFDAWKAQALRLVLGDWECYEVREVVLRIDQAALDAVFDVGPIDATVESAA